ncbi:hypothetical protein [Sphingobium yanoikuyae]|uniref:hypothetical protein n=1 Tax=Sphingobium yanoikuyae TaxID=13690 RepID=UPI0028DD332B|nr:hypothetical protein [Sphingobium yanoikuyae]
MADWKTIPRYSEAMALIHEFIVEGEDGYSDLIPKLYLLWSAESDGLADSSKVPSPDGKGEPSAH